MSDTYQGSNCGGSIETRERDIVERAWEFECYFFCTNHPCEGGEIFQAKPRRAFDWSEHLTARA